MNGRPNVIDDGDAASSQAKIVHEREKHPPSEDDLGGGDICSIEEEPSTDDDKQLD